LFQIRVITVYSYIIYSAVHLLYIVYTLYILYSVYSTVQHLAIPQKGLKHLIHRFRSMFKAMKYYSLKFKEKH